ncbi:heme oxygenase-like multi-helical [Penicillium soppii]|uniref:heme oxygenase-like multi-helical n=1 Tax=Penicillium soppii TaxID=69789 RepID=UPI0025470DA6|nr:heme oxygenase-like multi-helical [Penicillium soppii]KAJ5882081.1 heme oxygenase-like multi-helical [Penicillium soppii]
MLSSTETIDVIAETLQVHKVPIVVLDPVMVSTSGSQLLPERAVKELRAKLLPLTTILTPNIPEALLLLKDAGAEVPEPTDLDEMIELAKKICSLGPQAVLLKGGHLPLTKDHKISHDPREATNVVDILFDGKTATLFETEFLTSKNTHGTGCSLASAIAANLASGKDLIRSVRNAVRFVEYTLDRPDVQRVWQEFTHHDFVKGMGQGDLPLEHFKAYLVQDYLYLSAQIVLHIQREMALHIDYCTSFGLSKQEMEDTPETIGS